MKTKLLAIAALTVIMCLTNCSNEETMDGKKVDSGQDTYMQISITQTKAPGTYATNDINASDIESKLYSVDLFIYDVDAQTLETHKHLLAAEFTGPGTGTGTGDLWTKSNIPCKTGNKIILAALNITEAYGNEIEQRGYGFPSDSQFNVLDGLGNNALVDLSADGRGFAMFSVGEKTATLVPIASDPDVNTVTIPVQRLTAKVTLQKDEDLIEEAGGGRISDLEFTLATTNDKTYFMRDWTGTGTGAVQDHNWAGNRDFTSDGFYATTHTDITAAEYKNVNEAGVEVKALNALYCPENTSERFLQREATAAVARCKYIPGAYTKYINDVASDGFEDVNNATETVVKTFHLVTLANGQKKYFYDPIIAADYESQHVGSVTTTFEDGYSYYRVYLNPRGMASKTTIINNALEILPPAENTVGPYDVIRNAFYKITITKIVAPGNHFSEPVSPDEPIATQTNITAVIEVVNWDLVAQQEELTPM